MLGYHLVYCIYHFYDSRNRCGHRCFSGVFDSTAEGLARLSSYTMKLASSQVSIIGYHTKTANPRGLIASVLADLAPSTGALKPATKDGKSLFTTKLDFV